MGCCEQPELITSSEELSLLLFAQCDSVIGPSGGVGVSVLPRQPHRFEGLRVIPEEVQRDDLALTRRKDVRHLQISLRAMPCPTPDLPHGNSVANNDEVAGRYQRIGVPGLACLQPLAMTASLPTNGPGSGQPSAARTMLSGS
jgi:hypothetical protein